MILNSPIICISDQGTGWDLEEPGEDAEKYDKMMPTVVKPRRTSVFSMDALPLELGIIR